MVSSEFRATEEREGVVSSELRATKERVGVVGQVSGTFELNFRFLL